MKVDTLVFKVLLNRTRIGGEWFVNVVAGIEGQPPDRFRVGPIPYADLEAVERDIVRIHSGIMKNVRDQLDYQLYGMMHPGPTGPRK